MRLGTRLPTVLLLPDDDEPAFDVAGQKQIRYASLVDLEERLISELMGLVIAPGG